MDSHIVVYRRNRRLGEQGTDYRNQPAQGEGRFIIANTRSYASWGVSAAALLPVADIVLGDLPGDNL
jgi:hypothetical protein